MTPPLSSIGDNADSPGTLIRYPGFGACVVCGQEVDVFYHWSDGRNSHVIAYHGVRQCILQQHRESAQ